MSKTLHDNRTPFDPNVYPQAMIPQRLDADFPASDKVRAWVRRTYKINGTAIFLHVFGTTEILLPSYSKLNLEEAWACLDTFQSICQEGILPD